VVLVAVVLELVVTLLVLAAVEQDYTVKVLLELVVLLVAVMVMVVAVVLFQTKLHHLVLITMLAVVEMVPKIGLVV
tara:strand:+ start:311 stop:538 length:228 start_codon:yes stop_codon:yes gene_type:complete